MTEPTQAGSPETPAAAITQNADPAAILAGADVAQAPAVEVKPEIPVVDPAKDEKFASKFAVLSKKERQIQLRERAIAEKERMLSDKEKQYGKPGTPEEALERLGWTYEELTEYYLKGKEPENKRIREIEAKLKAAEDARAKEKEEATKAEQERAVSAYKASIKEHCLKAGDAFELINAWDQHEVVFDVIKKHFEDTSSSPGANDGEMMDMQKAAELVEKHFETELDKYTKLKKLQSRFQPKEQPKPEEKTGNSQAPAQQSRTLSNEFSQASTNTASKPTSREEDIKLAIKMLTA